jgi:hypothetical protein
MSEPRRIAYLIIAHVDAPHLARLVRALDDTGDIYVHLDAKADVEEFKRALVGGPEVVFIEPRVRISWASITQVNASLRLIRAVLDRRSDYCHLVLLSGTCYPLRPPRQIASYLCAHAGHEFIRYIDMRESPGHYLKLINAKWFKEPMYRGSRRPLVLADKAMRRGLNLLRLKNPRLPDIVPYHGSAFWALTPQFLRYAIDYVQANPAFYEMHRYTFSPDEFFYHTLMGNSEFRANATGLQPFQGRGTWRMANLHHIHPSLAKWYRLEDWDEVAKSDKFFLRKVTTPLSSSLLDRIDAELLGRGRT